VAVTEATAALAVAHAANAAAHILHAGRQASHRQGDADPSSSLPLSSSLSSSSGPVVAAVVNAALLASLGGTFAHSPVGSAPVGSSGAQLPPALRRKSHRDGGGVPGSGLHGTAKSFAAAAAAKGPTASTSVAAGVLTREAAAATEVLAMVAAFEEAAAELSGRHRLEADALRASQVTPLAGPLRWRTHRSRQPKEAPLLFGARG
jgi:hypothetical protein